VVASKPVDKAVKMIVKRKFGKYVIVAFPVKTSYWKPRKSFLLEVCRKLEGKISHGDVIVFSEKALSVALNNIYDESTVKPRFIHKIMAFLIMNILWGYVLGEIVKLKRETIEWIRKTPISEISAHKALSLKIGGLLQALKPSSEAGVDTSNVPYTYVSLPLTKCSIVEELRRTLEKCLEKKVSVLIVDSDRAYVHRRLSLALASRKTCLKHLRNYGVLSYILGRTFRDTFYPRATPVMYSGMKIDLRLLLEVAEVADRARGVGAGRTVFEMARRFGVSVGEVTWEMLSSIPHYPIVIVKFIRKEPHRRNNAVKSRCLGNGSNEI